MIGSANYKILPAPSADWAEGYEIQSPDKVFISWDTPIREMFENYSHLLKASAYGELYFEYPVRIGNMILESFQTRFPAQDDPRPFISFDAHGVDHGQQDKGFSEIYQNLLRQFKQPVAVYKDQSQNLLRSVFHFKGMDLVVYRQGIVDRGYVLLRWNNNRDYPYLMENAAYENKMVLSAQLLWREERLYLAEDYKRNLCIKQVPPVIRQELQGDATVIWRDDRCKMLGFARGELAHLYPEADVEHFSIQKVDDGRIGFGSRLQVHLKPDYWRPCPVLEYIGEPGAVHFFDDHLRDLEELLQKPVQLK